MRTIDADELLRTVTVSRDNNLHINKAERIAHYREHNRFLRMIERAPTVKPKDPRPKGKWEAYPNDLYLRCSACRMEFYIGHFPLTKKYCPNCGAKMEE